MTHRITAALLLGTVLAGGPANAQDRPDPAQAAGPTYFFSRDGRPAGLARRHGGQLLFYGPDGEFLGAGRRLRDTVLFYGPKGEVLGGTRSPGAPVPQPDVRSQLLVAPDPAVGPTLSLDAGGAVSGEEEPPQALPPLDRPDRQIDSLSPLDLGPYGAGVGAP